MKHLILRTLWAALLLAAAPVPMIAAPENPADTETAAFSASDWAEASLEVQGRNVHVRNAQGMTLDVFDITGKLVMSVRIDSNDKRISLSLGKGCYLVRVGKMTRKIALA